MIPAIIKNRERIEELERKNVGLQRRLDILITEMVKEKESRATLEAVMQAKLEFLEAKLGKVAQAADRREPSTVWTAVERREDGWG
jgi:uncharacterized protein YigA (DUF484 family)